MRVGNIEDRREEHWRSGDETYGHTTCTAIQSACLFVARGCCSRLKESMDEGQAG
jgi:hypothetical protein